MVLIFEKLTERFRSGWSFVRQFVNRNDNFCYEDINFLNWSTER